MIHIYCDGGLGNRLLMMFSGMCFAKAAGKDFIIHWPQNNWCGCYFHDLFDNDYHVTNLNLKFIDDHVVQRCVLLVHECQIKHKENPVVINCSISKEETVKILKTEPDVLYYGNSLHGSLTPGDVADVVSELRISGDIARRIAGCEIANSVGVHIRRTDFPWEPLIDMAGIEAELARTPDEKYFICSDQREIEESITSRFRNAWSFKKTSYVEKLDGGKGWKGQITDDLNRSYNFNVNRSRASAIEAFCDMVLLSKSKRRMMTSTSSFLKSADVMSQAQTTVAVHPRALNGDTVLQDMVRNLVKSADIQVIVETGTHVGWSTGFFSDLVPSVITTEISEKWQAEAKALLSGRGNIHFATGDSASYLEERLPSLGSQRVLFFLDSHFNNDMSLERELRAIRDSKVIPYILIHDFMVPGRNDLGYDSWDGKEYRLESFEKIIRDIYLSRGYSGYKGYYNVGSARGQRGCIILEPEK